MSWRGIEDVLEAMRQREEDADEALRQHYLAGSQQIEEEREQRIAEGKYGSLRRV